GLGDCFRTKEQRSRYAQANLRVAEVQAEVGADVVAAARLVLGYQAAFQDAQAGVRKAEEAWDRLLAITFGMGLPGEKKVYDALQPLIAVQMLVAARLNYLDNVIGYNKAQFELYWALGQPPACALPQAVAAPPVEVPAVPPCPAPRQPPTERKP